MTTPSALSCQELVELVTDYLEGALSPEDCDRFEEHLGSCQGCQIYLDQMRKTISVTGTLTEASIPTDAQQHLLTTFRDWKSGR
jgi:predicted anti-sigma-YlaC factor YlaD